MLSTYNKRFFVLDLGRALFYYLPEKGDLLSKATEIPLDSINRIYVEHQANLGASEINEKQIFVVLTKKKAYKLLCDSQLVMEQILFAFSNLIGAQSQKPLYDWNAYHNPQAQSNGDIDQEKPTHRRAGSKGPSSLNKMDQQQPMMPQQNMSRSQGMPHQNTSLPQQNMNKSQPVRVIYTTEQQQTPLSPSEREANQLKEVNKVEEEAQNVPKLSESRQSSQKYEPEPEPQPESEQPVQNQVSPKAVEAESANFQEKANSEVEHSSSPAHRKSASKENHQQVRGRIMAPGLNLNQAQNPDQMVEIQSLDLPSKQSSEETKSTPLSSRQLQSFRRASASRQRAIPTSAGIPISKVENMNAAPVRIEQDLTPNKLTRLSEDNGASKFESAASRPSQDDSSSRNNLNTVSGRPIRDDSSSRKNLNAVSSRPSRLGAESYGFISKDEPRLETIGGEDIPLSYLDIMKQKKKQNIQNTPDPSPKYEAPRHLDTEDDWDRELFGDDQVTPMRTQKNFDKNSLNSYNSQYISQPNQSSAQLPNKPTGMNERKIATSIKEKTESVSTQKYVHNDWDDDL